MGTVQRRPADSRRRPAWRRAPLHARSRMDHAVSVDDGHAANLRVVRGKDGLRRTFGDSVSCHECRLAGERSRARRHHDDVRGDDHGSPGRRQRRVRRRHAIGVSPASHRGAFSRRSSPRLGRHVGARGWRSRDRGRLRLHYECSRHGRARRDRDRRALRARLSAQGRRRGDQRTDQGDTVAAGRPPSRIHAR